MDWPTIDQELSSARYEIHELKQKLTEKEEKLQGMERDMRFHRIKSEELEAMIENKDPSELERELRVKILQNAGLTSQLKDLRSQLDEANYMQTSLEKDVYNAQDTIRRLGEERRAHQRMVIEMSDVLRMLGQIQVEYEKQEDASNWSTPERSLDNIKMKIHAIEEDRQRRIQENRELLTELFEKAIALEGYDEQATLLEAACKDRDQLIEENARLTRLCEKQENMIKSMDVSGVDLHGKFPVKNIVYIQSGEKEESVVEAVLQNDGSTVEVPSISSLSRITDDPAHQNLSLKPNTSEDETCSFSSLESPQVEAEVIEPKVEPEVTESEVKPEGKEPVETTSNEVAKLKQVLGKTQKKFKTAKEKQVLYENLLRDVIFHYKELQKDHNATAARLSSMMQRRNEGECDSERVVSEQKTLASGEALVKSPTFDTAESSQAQSMVDTSNGTNSMIQYQMSDPENYAEEGYNQLEQECARLEHQYDDAVVRIANLEDELASAKKELELTQSKSTDKQPEIDDFRFKLGIMEADLKASVAKAVRLQEDFINAETKLVEAKKKHQERELDLWDAIDQYKKLAEENLESADKIQSVEERLNQTQAMKKPVELGGTRRHGKRNDLVYDNIKLKQKVETYEDQIAALEHAMKQARSEAAVNKEDAECIRKLLANSNNNFQQLQERCEKAANHQPVVERDVSRTQRSSKLQERMEVFRRTREFSKAKRKVERLPVTPTEVIGAV